MHLISMFNKAYSFIIISHELIVASIRLSLRQTQKNTQDLIWIKERPEHQRMNVYDRYPFYLYNILHHVTSEEIGNNYLG